MNNKIPPSPSREAAIHEKGYTLDARLDDGTSDQVLVDTAGLEQPVLDGAMGESAFYSYRLKNGGHINATKLTPPDDMTITAESEDENNIIIAQIALMGRTSFSYLDKQEQHISPLKGCLYRYVGGTSTYQLRGGEMIHTCGVSLFPHVLMRYLDNDVPESFQPLFNSDTDTPVFIPFPVSQAMQTVMKNALNSPLEGALQQMHMEGVALQYIALIADALRNDSNHCEASLRKSDLNAAHKVYEELKVLLREPPSMSELSESSGITERRLNKAFRELYDGTVFETLRDIRLGEARKMLEQTDMAIKEIAWKVGYEHNTNFTNAFTAKFGTSPAAYANPFRKVMT